MDEAMILSCALCTIVFLLLFKFLCPTSHNLPPGPLPLPIFGNIHLMKPPIHLSFLKLHHKYGPIFSLKLGFRLAVVVSTASLAEECLSKNDMVLANRPTFLVVGKHLAYNSSTLITAPYGDHWRNLRRICATQIFSSTRLYLSQNIRKDEIERLLLLLAHESIQGFAKVELKTAFTDLTFNIMTRIVAGKRYYGEYVTDKKETTEAKNLLLEVLEIFNGANAGDHLPIVNLFHGKYEKRVKNLSVKMDELLQGLIDEKRSRNGNDKNDMIHHLLSLQESQPNYYTDEIIKGLALVMLVGGIDTTAATLEWAMSNLLNHPEVLVKAKSELDAQVGLETLIDEQDLSNLPYLQSVILETFRFITPGPNLVPHFSSKSCTIAGYNMPPDTIVFINAWAIHRDPELWDDPLDFKPERFHTGEGLGFKLMPFGLGRRACPGEALAQRVLGLTLGSLIQCFEWKRISEEKIDLTGGGGLLLSKVQPLTALCNAYPIIKNIMTG